MSVSVNLKDVDMYDTAHLDVEQVIPCHQYRLLNFLSLPDS